MFFLKRMKCSLQYGHLLCKNLIFYDCCMLYNCIICLNVQTCLCFGFFSFIEATAWIKLFLLQLTMTTTVINQHGATRFLRTLQRISLKEVNWNNINWKDCPYYQKEMFYISLIWTALSYLYSYLHQTKTIYAKLYLLSVYNYLMFEHLWCSILSCIHVHPYNDTWVRQVNVIIRLK